MSVRVATKQLSWSQSQTMSVCLATMGALALALLSQVKIYLPGTPVPITLQVLAVIMLGGLLGPRLGLAAVLEYLLLGICGLPVFAGWTSGIAILTGATAGYLFAFPVAAVLCGMVYSRFAAQSYARRVAGATLMGIVGTIVIYLGGWLWLANWGHLALSKAFTLGVTPFIIADILKVSVAATGLALRRKGTA
ncbi:MAG TPA: biotin transporter BioY [Armatimonadota bacterium]|nr:biotin transporter BioY [Armatimonadota bacterium]